MKRSARLIQIRPNDKSPLASGDCAHDEERLGTGCNRLRQRRVYRIVRNVFAANKEAHQWPAFLRVMIPDGPAQHWIASLERVENFSLRNLTIELEFHFTANVRQRAQMMRENDADHITFSVQAAAAPNCVEPLSTIFRFA
jgi:hypothetical protein